MYGLQIIKGEALAEKGFLSPSVLTGVISQQSECHYECIDLFSAHREELGKHTLLIYHKQNHKLLTSSTKDSRRSLGQGLKSFTENNIMLYCGNTTLIHRRKPNMNDTLHSNLEENVNNAGNKLKKTDLLPPTNCSQKGKTVSLFFTDSGERKK